MKILINTLRLVTSEVVLPYNCTVSVMQELLLQMVFNLGNNNNDCGLPTYSLNKGVNSN